MNIYQKMSAITMEVNAIAKNLLIEAGATKYKAVSEADVLAAIKPIEAKHGVYSYPYSRKVIDSGVITSLKKGYEVKQQYLRIETIYRFVNVDKPDEYIDMTSYGDGVDPMDKATGKAITYSDKYSLLKAYKCITGDDPDQYASDQLVGKEQTNRVVKTDKDRAVAAYPDRKMMLEFIDKNAPEAAKVKMKDYYNVGDFADMSDEQLMVCFARTERFMEEGV